MHTLHSMVVPTDGHIRIAFFDKKKYFQDSFDEALRTMKLDYTISYFDTLLNEYSSSSSSCSHPHHNPYPHSHPHRALPL